MTEADSLSTPSVSVVIVAAGAGTRMRMSTRKPYLDLVGRPILFHTLDRFRGLDGVREIVLVVAPGDVDRVSDGWGAELTALGVSRVIAGGAERADSVALGVDATTHETELVAIHDGVRPFVSRPQLRAVLAAAHRHGGAILAVPVRDTIKLARAELNRDIVIENTVDRERLWAAQTPQVFRASLLRAAIESWRMEPFPVTDDASLVERLSTSPDFHGVALVPGASTNLKITSPDDLPLAEFIASRFDDTA